MSRRKPETPGTSQNDAEKTTHPPTGEQFKKVQLALLARSLQNIDFEFDVTTREGLISLQAELLHLSLQRKLSAPDASACSHQIRNLIQLVVPDPEVAVKNEVHVAPRTEPLTPEEQVTIARAIKVIERTAAQPRPAPLP